MAKKVKDEIKATKKNLEPEVVAKRPASTLTEIFKPEPVKEAIEKSVDLIHQIVNPQPIAKVEIQPQSDIDYLRMPLGLLDFETAGVLFKNADAPNNRKLIDQFNLLKSLGYKATLRIVDNNYAYFQFDKA